MRWILLYGDNTMRYQSDGLRFHECSPIGICAVGVEVSNGCVVKMAVPDGAVVEMYYEHVADLVMGANETDAMREGLERLKFGWRMHDGSKREAWMRVGDDGLVESIDPNRTWPNEGEPNLHG